MKLNIIYSFRTIFTAEKQRTQSMDSKYEKLMKKIIAFRDERDWAQYHDPKNLATAISIEAAELQEIFLWQTAEASQKPNPEKLDQVKDEVADIFIFLSYLCAACNINLHAAVEKKLSKNELKYPVEKSKGLSTKYTDL